MPSAAGARTCFQVPAGAEGLARKKKKNPEKMLLLPVADSLSDKEESQRLLVAQVVVGTFSQWDPLVTSCFQRSDPRFHLHKIRRRGVRRQTLRRRAGACICSSAGGARRTPAPRRRCARRGFLRAPRRRPPALGLASRCRPVRWDHARKKSKKSGKNVVTIDRLIRPLDRRSATYLCHEGILLSCGSSSLWKRRKCAQQKYGRRKCAQWKCGWWKCAQQKYGRRKCAQWKCGWWKCEQQKYGRRKCAQQKYGRRKCAQWKCGWRKSPPKLLLFKNFYF